jgi:putative lipoic acid-binding regulatory protein
MTTPNAMTVQNIEAWELPRHHAFKVLGEMQYPLAQIVADIACKHCPSFNAASMTMRPSSGGKYLAVTIEVYLEHHEQINGLYADFNAAPEIKLVY